MENDGIKVYAGPGREAPAKNRRMLTMLYEEKIIETIPVGPLGLIPLKSCTELGNKVDAYLVDWRRERESEHKSTIAFSGYQRDSYIINAVTPRFGTGEGKGLVDRCHKGRRLVYHGRCMQLQPDLFPVRYD